MGLRYCKENVLWVCNQFESLAKRDGMTKAQLRETYSMLETRRAQLDEVRNDPHVWEHCVKKDLFETLIRVLRDHGALTLTDDHLLLESIDGYVYHALNGWYGRRENPKVLAGKYRVFQPSAITGQVLIGELIIQLDAASNSLSTVMRQKYQLEGMAVQEHFIRGVIVRVGSSRCLWLDKDANGQRYCSLDILSSSTYEDESAECVTLMQGWSQVMSTRPVAQYVRRIMLVRCSPAEEIIPGQYPLDDQIPMMLRPYLVASPQNLMPLPPFQTLALFGSRADNEEN